MDDKQAILDGLKRYQIALSKYEIDIEDFKQYFVAAEYKKRYPRYYPAQILEKSLEHYLAQKFLKLRPEDIYIDIASQESPAPMRLNQRMPAPAAI